MSRTHRDTVDPMDEAPGARDTQGAIAAALDAIADDPAARVERRRAFYRRTARGLPGWCGGAGEVAFARWIERRGALARSPWYRAVQRELALHSELAEARVANGTDGTLRGPPALWAAWLRDRSPRAWFRAHDATVLHGALAHRDLASLEPPPERALLAFNLHRMLSLHALLEGDVLGAAGARLASPRLPWARLFLAMPWLYPRDYPATEAFARGTFLRGIADDGTWLQRLSERTPLTLRPDRLFALAAGWLDLPGVAGLGTPGGVRYPGGQP